MKVQILSYTHDALELLLATKETRLGVDSALEEINLWSWDKKMEQLDYMMGTIQSSWEFVDFTFLISGVSRAFTHQLVRSRQGSYAQQSQRTVDMSGFEFIMPEALAEAGDPEGGLSAVEMVEFAQSNYAGLIAAGVAPQDARALLPTNVATNIVAKFNLRTLSEMARLRLCTRTQGEYQDVFRVMVSEVINLYPWAHRFLRVYCAAVGVCAFPNYTECPLKPGIFNPDTGDVWVGKTYDDIWIAADDQPFTREEIQKRWEKMKRFEATPVVRGDDDARTK